MGAKHPQQFWEKWAAFRPVWHTNQKWFSQEFFPKNSSPKILPQKWFPKNSSPKILSRKLLTSNGCKTSPTILRKMGSISPCFTHKPKVTLPRILPQNSSPKNYWHRMAAQNILTDCPQQFWEKWAAFRPVFHTNQSYSPNNSSPRILPKKSSPKMISQEFFPQNSLPKIVDIEWVQNIFDWLPPTILRKMGSISPCFTHKPKVILPKLFKILPPKPSTSNGCKRFLTSWPQQFWEKWAAFCPVLHKPRIIAQQLFPRNSSPKILPPPPKKISENYFPRILPKNLFPQNCWHRMGANICWHHGPNNSDTNGQHFALSYTNQKWFSQTLFSNNSSPKSIPPKILTSNGRK